MGRKDRSLIWNTMQRKRMWFVRLLRLAESAIGWDGFPGYVDWTYLEYLLCRNGSAIVVYDEITDKYVVGQNASTGLLDIYGYPVNRRVIFRNGKSMAAYPENSVIVYNNAMRNNDVWIFDLIADEMCNIDMAIRVNVNTQKTMPLIPVQESQILGVKNLMNDMITNEPYKLVDPNGLDIEAFKTALLFDNKRSFTADNMITVQRELWNRALSFIGVNNTNIEKKERINTFETNANLDEIGIMRQNRMNARKYAANLMKEKFGLEVEPFYHSEKGVDANGAVYGQYAGIANERVAKEEP